MSVTKMVTVAAMQMTYSWDIEENIKCAEQMVREGALKGAQIILIQELFETPTLLSSNHSNIWSWQRR